MKEFRVEKADGYERSVFVWAVVWHECDGRIVSRSVHEYQARAICKLLNESNAAAVWYKRAQTALALRAAERRS